jgi:outer membrane protein W
LKLSVQPGIQIPIGDFSNTAALGLGVNATLEYLFSQKKGIDWSLTVMTGYNHFAANKDLPEGEDYSYGDIPILAGLRFYIGKSDFRPYIGGEMGLHLLTITHNDAEISDSYFGYAPIVGLKSNFTRSLELDINLKLNSISSEGSSLSYVGFNFGLQFALGK